MLNWAYFPRSARPTSLALEVVEAFARVHSRIDSDQHMHASDRARLPLKGILILGY